MSTGEEEAHSVVHVGAPCALSPVGDEPGGSVLVAVTWMNKARAAGSWPACRAEQKGSFTVMQLVVGPACRNNAGTGLQDTCCLGRLCCASTALMPVQRFS